MKRVIFNAQLIIFLIIFSKISSNFYRNMDTEEFMYFCAGSVYLMSFLGMSFEFNKINCYKIYIFEYLQATQTKVVTRSRLKIVTVELML